MKNKNCDTCVRICKSKGRKLERRKDYVKGEKRNSCWRNENGYTDDEKEMDKFIMENQGKIFEGKTPPSCNVKLKNEKRLSWDDKFYIIIILMCVLGGLWALYVMNNFCNDSPIECDVKFPGEWDWKCFRFDDYGNCTGSWKVLE